MPEEKSNYLFVDFPPFGEIIDEDRDGNLKRAFTGGVRINGGKYRTAEEDREYRERSLKRKLP
jgi:hypothetical protein